MKKLLGAAVLLAALAAFVVTAAAADTGGTDRPFTGTLVGSGTFAPDSACPIGLRTVSEGSGTASHLGLVSMSFNHCAPPADVITGGQMTLVAANEDEVHMTYSGTCDAPPFPPVGEVITCNTENVIVGGTGRFANATGEAHLTARVTMAGFDVPEWPFTMTWDGALSY
jgi:hypothetical protein